MGDDALRLRGSVARRCGSHKITCFTSQIAPQLKGFGTEMGK